MPSVLPVPRDFLCEHTSTKSRVFAVLASPGVPDTLKAVLTCTDPVLAQRAASTLAALAHTGGGDAVNAEAEEVAAALPAAPAASFREGCRQLQSLEWPETDAGPTHWDQFWPTDEDDLIPALRDEEKRTPSGARLGQLAGKVFRVFQFLEYHVHDEGRLLAAAAAGGWPPDDEHYQPGSSVLPLDAVMHMAGSNHEIPGADIICQESSGEELTAAKGDELADWLREPVTVKFGGGPLPAESGVPDLAALFPVRSCDLEHADEDEAYDCEICGDWQLTPRTADMLHTALETLSDEAHDDADRKGDEPVPGKNTNDWSLFDRLPRITWTMNAKWRHDFGHACEDLVRDLVAGQWPQPRCTAEEMALHLAIQDAPGYLEMWQDAEDEHHEALPKHPDDYDWHACSEFLFEDHDVLMLFDEGLDGLDNPSNELNHAAGVGDLRAAAWFKPFSHLQPREPGRSFRR
ncbi:MAG: hypothetical protein J2P25_17815 [Nocardiopsaceae bacterium]|nr:hypothetical protein [Nocardiopsaceae bacterium]